MKNNPTDCYTLHIASSAFQIPDKPSPEERLLALLDVLSGSATFKPWLQNAPSSLVRSPCWPCWGWGTGRETSCIPLSPSFPAVLCQCFLHLIGWESLRKQQKFSCNQTLILHISEKQPAFRDALLWGNPQTAHTGGQADLHPHFVVGLTAFKVFTVAISMADCSQTSSSSTLRAANMTSSSKQMLYW